MPKWFAGVAGAWNALEAAVDQYFSSHGGMAQVLLAVSVVLVGWAASNLWKRLSSRKTAAPEQFLAFDPALRLALLHKVQTQLVRPRLNLGLREAIRVDLHLTEAAEQVATTLRRYSRQEVGTARGEGSGQSVTQPIHEIFEQSGGSLLILGEPGTGKTKPAGAMVGEFAGE